MPKTIAQREHAQRLDAIHASIAAILAAADADPNGHPAASADKLVVAVYPTRLALEPRAAGDQAAPQGGWGYALPATWTRAHVAKWIRDNRQDLVAIAGNMRVVRYDDGTVRAACSVLVNAAVDRLIRACEGAWRGAQS